MTSEEDKRYIDLGKESYPSVFKRFKQKHEAGLNVYTNELDAQIKKITEELSEIYDTITFTKLGSIEDGVYVWEDVDGLEIKLDEEE